MAGPIDPGSSIRMGRDAINQMSRVLNEDCSPREKASKIDAIMNSHWTEILNSNDAANLKNIGWNLSKTVTTAEERGEIENVIRSLYSAAGMIDQPGPDAL